MFITIKSINGEKVTKDNTLKDILHKIYAKPQGKKPDKTYYNFYQMGRITMAWEKCTDKKHNDLFDDLLRKHIDRQARKGRGRLTTTFDGMKIVSVSS